MTGWSKLFFMMIYSVECHLATEDICYNQEQHCIAQGSGTARRRRSSGVEAGNKTFEVNVGFGSGSGSAQGAGDGTSGSQPLCETTNTFWIICLVLAGLLIVAVICMTFLYFRLKAEQRKSDKLDQTYGVTNPTF